MHEFAIIITSHSVLDPFILVRLVKAHANLVMFPTFMLMDSEHNKDSMYYIIGQNQDWVIMQ
jgi:hypothetical protein